MADKSMTRLISMLLLTFLLHICPAWAQSWGFPPVSPDEPVPTGNRVLLGSDVFLHAPFLAASYRPEDNARLPVRFQEDPLAASSLEGYLRGGRELGYGHTYLQSTGLCRYFAWSDLFSWHHFRRTGERRYFSPTYMFAGFVPGIRYTRHIEEFLTQGGGALLREDDVRWRAPGVPSTWPRHREILEPFLQPEMELGNLRFFLHTNPHKEERTLAVRNTDRMAPDLDDDGNQKWEAGRPREFNPNPSAYEQMDWGTVLKLRQHLLSSEMPAVAMYFEPGGRTGPSTSLWTGNWERFDRSWAHAVLVLGFDDDLAYDDMSGYTLYQERRLGVPLVRQTSFWPSHGVFFIRDSFGTETTMMSYAKFLRLGIFVEGLEPAGKRVSAQSR